MRDFGSFSGDARQTKQWGNYLSQIGWDIENIGNLQIFIRKIPLINCSVIKIQHPKGPIPFQKINDIAKKYHALLVLIEPDQVGYKETDYIKFKYQKSKLRFVHTSTIKIDLSRSKKTLWQSFSENARRNIRKSQNNNLIVKKVFLKKEKDDQQFKNFYHLLKNLSKVKNFYIPGYDEYFKKMTAFKDTSILLFGYLPKDPQPIAVVWYAYYGKTISYFQTGITDAGYKVFANYLLVWEGLKLAKKLKLKVFDFEATYDPRYPKDHKSWKNFTEFKKRFHGQVVEYPQVWIKFYNPIFKYIYTFSTLFDN